MRRVRIWTDGCCLVNPGGPGGWAFVVESGGPTIHEASGGEPSTTNNRMEMLAVIEALRWMPASGRFEIVSDSTYVVKGASQWMRGWKRRGWRKKGLGGALIKNADLWQTLDALVHGLPAAVQVDFRWVKGHNNHEFNEHADLLAGQAAEAAREGPRDPAEEFVERFGL